MAFDHCTVINSVRPFWFDHKEQFKWLNFFADFLLKYFEYCVSYFLGHWLIRFLDQRKPLLCFLNFPKFEYGFLCTISYVPILSLPKVCSSYFYQNLFICCKICPSLSLFRFTGHLTLTKKICFKNLHYCLILLLLRYLYRITYIFCSLWLPRLREL